jgi:diguanylate cyclase (GGDEF)-like protein
MFRKYLTVTHGDFRAKTAQICALAGIAILTPLAIKNFLDDKDYLVLAMCAYIGAMICSVWIIHKNEDNLRIVQWIIIPTLAVVLSSAIYTLGVAATYWLFPVVVVVYIIMPQRGAWVVNSILFVLMSIIGWNALDHEIAIRLIASFLLLSLLVASVMFIIDNQQKQLNALAITDSLTGLLNRVTLSTSLDHAVNQSMRANIPMTLIAMDLDNFKEVNDNQGHDAGDEVLRNVSGMLHERFRNTDRVYRCGGDEFLILLFNTDCESGTKAAEQLRSSMASFEGRITTASFGVAEYQKDEIRDAWTKRADNKLYQAKESGQNRVAS